MKLPAAHLRVRAVRPGSRHRQLNQSGTTTNYQWQSKVSVILSCRQIARRRDVVGKPSRGTTSVERISTRRAVVVILVVRKVQHSHHACQSRIAHYGRSKLPHPSHCVVADMKSVIQRRTGRCIQGSRCCCRRGQGIELDGIPRGKGWRMRRDVQEGEDVSEQLLGEIVKGHTAVPDCIAGPYRDRFWRRNLSCYRVQSVRTIAACNMSSRSGVSRCLDCNVR